MFSIQAPNFIVSDEGFSVQVLGRTGVRYADQLGTVTLDGEVLAGPAGFMIYRDSMLVDGAGKEQLDDARRERILQNIQRAFSFRGFEIEII